MKIIAFYLPQFHTIPENNKWWGKGFTEWTNTKKAKPLFNNQYQPKEPLNDYYYDLTDPDARRWQAELAKKYGIYGFCYYHYWFQGKLLLEKPLRQVLTSGEPDFPFCICWANEPWTRTWDGKDKEVLMPQSYGDKKDWKDHFEYLLKAFLDPRYILLDNKPLFVIYRPANVERCDEMLEYWDELARQKGLDGIYFVESLTAFKKSNWKNFQAKIEFEPFYTLMHQMPLAWHLWRRTLNLIIKIKNKFGKKGHLPLVNYDLLWKNILKRKPDKERIFPGAFVSFDNTSRKGYNALIIEGATPEKFEEYLAQQIERSKEIYKSEFLFINAWNEWAEGAFLEPDKQHGFAYLKAVKNALCSVQHLFNQGG